ncbi:hypothetical protein BVX97_04050 [bacterium E08(2017)]|nr:hypothetical protein BVX97_04050 [bacterium E08(2017)]
MIRMPWNNQTAPNLMLEVTDACNADCKVCYKKKGDRFKSLKEVQNDIESAMSIRKLHTITISGGEPTLHPELCSIITMISEKGLHAFLLTNGVLVDNDYLVRMKESGLDSILFHVETNQERSDLPLNQTEREARTRLRNLIYMAKNADLDVSMSMTFYDGDMISLASTAHFFLNNPDLTFLFIARGQDVERLHAEGQKNCSSGKLDDVIRFFKADYNIEPFSYIPATGGKGTVWISYFVPIIYSKGGKKLFRIRSTALDSWLMELPRIITGRYIHKTTQKTFVTMARVFVNSMASIRPHLFVTFLWNALKKTSVLRHKMIVYDDGPHYTEDGNLIKCEYCPTGIVRGQDVLCCCTADYGNQNMEACL